MSVSLRLGQRVLERFEREGFRPVLIGGLAVAAAGLGTTKDVDLLVTVGRFDELESFFDGTRRSRCFGSPPHGTAGDSGSLTATSTSVRDIERPLCRSTS